MRFLIPSIITFEVPTAAAVHTSSPKLDRASGSIYDRGYAVGGTILHFRQGIEKKQKAQGGESEKIFTNLQSLNPMPRTVDDNQSRKMWRRFSRRTKMVIKFPHEGYRLFHSCANTSGNDLPKTRTNCYCFNFHIIPCSNWPYFSIFQFQHLCPWNPCLFGHQYGPLRQRRVFQRLSSPLQAQKVTRWHRHGCHGKANRSNKNFLVKRDTWHYHQLLNARNHSNKKYI